MRGDDKAAPADLMKPPGERPWTLAEAMEAVRSRPAPGGPRVVPMPRPMRPPVPAVNAAECTGCGVCVEVCMADAIQVGRVASIEQGRCIGCMACVQECPEGAITLPAPGGRPGTTATG